MMFDYYTASIAAEPDQVVTMIENSTPDTKFVRSRPRSGYERAYKAVRGDFTFAEVQWGGPTVGERVWASGTGCSAPEFAELVRSSFPDSHRLLRADVAIDYCSEGAWDHVSSVGLAAADKFGLKTSVVGDYHRAQDGRTLYIGSRRSPAFQRIYEKGKKEGGHPDWVRSEIEIKPKTIAAKAAYSKASPRDMWFATSWTSFVAKTLEGIEGLRLAPLGTVRRLTDDERALAFMGKQYGNVLNRLLERHGGDLELFALSIIDAMNKKD